MTRFSSLSSIFLVNLKQKFSYRFDTFLSLFLGPIFVYLNTSLWIAIFTAKNSAVMGGFSLDQMLVYVTLASCIWYVLGDNIPDRVRDAVHQGTLTGYLLRPLSFPFSELSYRLASALIGAFTKFIPAFVIIYIFISGEALKEAHLLYFLGMLPISLAMGFLIRFTLGLVSFWVPKPNGIFFLFNVSALFIYGGVIPLSYYPAVLQKIYLLLPFQFVVYVPTSLAAGHYTLGGLTLGFAGAFLFGLSYVILFGLFVYFLWRRALLRYTGSGV